LALLVTSAFTALNKRTIENIGGRSMLKRRFRGKAQGGPRSPATQRKFRHIQQVVSKMPKHSSSAVPDQLYDVLKRLNMRHICCVSGVKIQQAEEMRRL
jgi:cytochrome P450